jgi:hypothetical protein
MLGIYMERNMWKFQHNKEIDVLKRGGAVGADINWNNTIQNVNSEHCIIHLHTKKPMLNNSS